MFVEDWVIYMTKRWSTGILRGYVFAPVITLRGVGSLLLDVEGNILVNNHGHACIADFGLLTIIPDRTSFISTISHLEGGTIRWMSPELLNPEPFGLEDSCPTTESDCYALGMVVYEVLSGQVPFALWKGTVVILKVMEGKRPERPRGTQGAWFTDRLWEVLELCWEHQPRDRPSLKTLLRCLENIPPPSQPLSPTPTMGGGTVEDTNGPLDPSVSSLSTLSTPLKYSGSKRLRTKCPNLDELSLPHPDSTAVPSPLRKFDSFFTSSTPFLTQVTRRWMSE